MSVTATESGIAAAVADGGPKAATRRHFLPLVVDVAVPIGSYYLLKSGFGMSTMAALGWSSVVPAVRTVWSVVRERTVNALAALILFVNVAGLLLSLVAGDPRLMLAKDSGVSSVIGIGVLVSVMAGRPMMTTAMKPFVTKGDPARTAAWERLIGGSERFRRFERTFSLVWGVALLGECVVRIVGAYTLPVDTMVWLGTVVMIGTMALAMVVSGGLAAGPMEAMVRGEAAGRTGEL
ncbi:MULTISPECIES: VC0807 family protein [unclassified Streptomyces]|uniref:VC0807 family protein n=1 Tax=unclassified Streptomyces TaxID=2593676 RepID=UPI00331F7C42